jgi:hypothetical protein
MSDVLEQELRAMAPRPTEAFAAELDARVADRFGAKPAPARRRRRFTWPSMPQLLAGSLASAFVAAIVVVAIVAGGSNNDGSTSTTSSAAAVADMAAPEAAAPSTASAGSGGGVAATQARRVERRAQLTVSVEHGRFDEAAARVPQIAAAANAIVDTSRVSSGRSGGEAAYTLRVPVGRLSDTLAQLSRLGRVTSRDETGNDITGAVVSAEDRLGDLRAERDSVRRQLAAETDPDKAQELSRRLNGLRSDIARARGEAIRLQQRTSYAVVQLTLDERTVATGGGGDDDQHGGIAGALDDAGRILGGMAAVGIVVVAVGLPVALLLALLWKGASVLRRRRREAGLA